MVTLQARSQGGRERFQRGSALLLPFSIPCLAMGLLNVGNEFEIITLASTIVEKL